MKSITYINGDATNPNGVGNKIIVHICNDVGGWGKGFVLALTKKWKEPEEKYREWYNSKIEFELGKVQFVQVQSDIWVANLIGQHKIHVDKSGNPPIRYEAIATGLNAVSTFANRNNSSIHMPRIGCRLAGGNWEHIEPMILSALSNNDIDVTVYDF